jgi:hypothetical protein
MHQKPDVFATAVRAVVDVRPGARQYGLRRQRSSRFAVYLSTPIVVFLHTLTHIYIQQHIIDSIVICFKSRLAARCRPTSISLWASPICSSTAPISALQFPNYLQIYRLCKYTYYLFYLFFFTIVICRDVGGCNLSGQLPALPNTLTYL